VQLGTPYSVVTAVERARGISKAELIGVSRTLEQTAFEDPPRAALAALQDQRYLTRRTRLVYHRLAQETGAAVTLHARGLQSWVAEGVRGVDLDDQDPLVDEWVVVLLNRRRPAVMAAVDLQHPAAVDVDRSFAYAVSHDPEVVTTCAALLGYEGEG